MPRPSGFPTSKSVRVHAVGGAAVASPAVVDGVLLQVGAGEAAALEIGEGCTLDADVGVDDMFVFETWPRATLLGRLVLRMLSACFERKRLIFGAPIM